MLVSTTTILCVDCKEIYDVVTHNLKEGRDKKVRCPKKASHEIRLWTAPGQCPRCDVPGMAQAADGEVTMWD